MGGDLVENFPPLFQCALVFLFTHLRPYKTRDGALDSAIVTHSTFATFSESVNRYTWLLTRVRFSENKKVIGTGQQNYSNFNPATSDALELFVAGAILAIDEIDREL